jgi:hypothetical protein
MCVLKGSEKDVGEKRVILIEEIEKEIKGDGRKRGRRRSGEGRKERRGEKGG